MNRAIIIGRISNDLELKKTLNNKSVLEFDVAVKKERKNDNGTYDADFIRVVCWEQKADFLSSYGKKGTLVGVSGRLETSSYEKDGRKVYKTYITADSVEILESKKETYGQQTLTGDNRDVRGFTDESAVSKVTIDDDELPFY